MKLFSIFIIFVSLSYAGAEALNNIDETKKLSEDVMKLVGKGNIKGGVKLLRPYVVYPLAEHDAQISQVDVQMPTINQRFGNTNGYDFVSEQRVGESLVKYIYLQKLEKHVLIWKFIFYKPNEKWLLNSWSFNDQIEQLFN
ncbi:MAG TPA: hypothetical protein ENO02_09230 [Epsilonproteobacteria bacterium]|nr:hypothetical protein [Campylobacterota bacterium]